MRDSSRADQPGQIEGHDNQSGYRSGREHRDGKCCCEWSSVSGTGGTIGSSAKSTPFAETALDNHPQERCRKLIAAEGVFGLEVDTAIPLRSQRALRWWNAPERVVFWTKPTRSGYRGLQAAGLQFETESRSILPLWFTPAGKLSRAQARLLAEQLCLKEHLIIHVRTFSLTTGIPPYTAEQMGTALQLAQTMNRERKAQRLSSGLLPRGWDTARCAAYLQTQGFALRAVRTPAVPHGSACLRFSLTSGISDDELVRLESPLNNWREQESRSAAVARA